MMIFIFYDISGGHFNPAITIACTIGSGDPKGNLVPAAFMIGG
jgi:glycerol uptake facilitator-like aquaporin